MKSLTNGITDILIESGAVSEKERHIYHYCVEGLIEMGGNLLLTVIIGILAGKLLETILFLLIIIPLRSIAGGFHAESGRVCFVISLLIYILTIFTADVMTVNLNSGFSLWLFAIGITIILILSPVDCKNKRQSAEEKKRNKKRSFAFIGLISIIFMILSVLKLTSLCFLIACSLTAVSILLLLGAIKNLKSYRSGV